ncbi:carbohydrate ABC transporter permease [Ktedonosporobacter rubrisoli]|uniref:Carbohydrate ABC transporter permease n=1 Tax=Ktedonosporobacter rubrisoli TaxID=2509675 RepID=A0A4P6JHT5_KTERU|nr:carbohydrate ABC transporter permease [Ktedonosporobacter rubrisoli]QBD74599.1 carbohydrate ABC transporter permease [Ktedonosporobacter rubrisoli]
MLSAHAQDRKQSRDAETPRGKVARAGHTKKQNLWVYALLSLGLILVGAPFIWMLFGSVKTEAELTRIPPTWFPQAPTWDNYVKLFSLLNFPTYVVNSVLITLAVTVLNLLFCSMLGYALAKLKFRGKHILFLLVLGTLMVPGAVTLVPLFVLMSKLHLVNSLSAVILPEAAASMGVFLMRQFMMDIPDELLDAGRVDGASELFIYSRLVLPLSGPALATLAILTFLSSWNDFLWPLIVLTSDQKYNLPVALATFAVGQHTSDTGLLMAGAVIVVIPVIAVFLLLQRYFTQGIVMTGLKG